MKATKILILIGIATLIAPQIAMAVVTFDQLDDDLFVISHRVKVKFWMSRGQAMRKVYEKAGSICLAAGYTHFEILQQESQAGQWQDDANASVRVRFFFEGSEERIECRRTASDRYIEQATVKLAKRGYRPPPPTAGSSAEAKTGSGS
ncbi:MAG: hypothetical protein GY769_24980 [bacterium]|nr:hypothetical protein [bacterium]